MPNAKGTRQRLKVPKGPVKVRDVISSINPTLPFLEGQTGGGFHQNRKAEQAKRACRDKKGRSFMDSGLAVDEDD